MHSLLSDFLTEMKGKSTVLLPYAIPITETSSQSEFPLLPAGIQLKNTKRGKKAIF